jgi:hypothetical protein
MAPIPRPDDRIQVPEEDRSGGVLSGFKQDDAGIIGTILVQYQQNTVIT